MDKKKSFGSLIRESRIKNGFGQRQLATKIGVAASYLNDIEKEKRSAPKQIVIKKISKLLKINIDTLNDLAGISKGNVAPDIGEYIESNPKIVSLIRTIKENNLDEGQIEKIENSLNKSNNKALIIAAGLGSRLKKHTENLPKCMLDFGGKTLLQRQLDSYKKCGIRDISLIRGYKKEKINYKGIKYFENTDYRNNNILNSIFYAEKVINGNIIISYSDILFDSSIMNIVYEASLAQQVKELKYFGPITNNPGPSIYNYKQYGTNTKNDDSFICKYNNKYSNLNGFFMVFPKCAKCDKVE